MLDGPIEDDGAEAAVRLTESNFGCFPGVNGLTRLEARCLDDEEAVSRARRHADRDLDGSRRRDSHRLVTFTPDDIDWEEEVRIALEARAAFSPDALTGMEASLRCPGPETMESRIFGRLTAWQNWIFQRENAVGETRRADAVRHRRARRLRPAASLVVWISGIERSRRIDTGKTECSHRGGRNRF